MHNMLQTFFKVSSVDFILVAFWGCPLAECVTWHVSFCVIVHVFVMCSSWHQLVTPHIASCNARRWRSTAWTWCCTSGMTGMARTSVAGGLVQRRGLVIPSYSVLDVLGEVDFARTRFVHILFKNMFNLFNVFWYFSIQLANVRLVEIKSGPTIQRKHLHLLWVAGRHNPVAAVSLSIANPIFYGSVQQQQNVKNTSPSDHFCMFKRTTLHNSNHHHHNNNSSNNSNSNNSNSNNNNSNSNNNIINNNNSNSNSNNNNIINNNKNKTNTNNNKNKNNSTLSIVLLFIPSVLESFLRLTRLQDERYLTTAQLTILSSCSLRQARLWPILFTDLPVQCSTFIKYNLD